ncbi:MAG TPA: thioredoxin family protein, partial [Roseiflexaceae bacterium]|nr:thioredoxin family protein [Roseiflexaceae bacterium]
TVSAPRSLTIHGRSAIQYEIHGTYGNVNYMYVLTHVDGTQNYYEVVAWTVESKAEANRAALQQVSESFQEGKAAPTAQLIYDPRADADAAIAQALTQAEADHKRVLLDFGADWCPDCQVLSQLFDDPQVKPFLDEHYHVVRIDVGQWDNNLDIAERYGDPIAKGIPAVVVLDANGQTLSSTAGGELANARTATADEILALLKQWSGSN